MKRLFAVQSPSAMQLVIVALIGALLPAGTALGAAIPPPALLPLNQIAVPEPPNLFQFVKSKPAAIRLGKAFFWDMQAGSDGVQACASCHFSAGADNRLKNTVNPGSRGGDTTFQVRKPNEVLQPGDFPFHQRQDPDFQISGIVRDVNDVVGSQGVKLTQFVDIVPGSAIDSGTPLADQIFNVGANPNNIDPATNTRRVTARNTPSNINAIFNFNNFWDGRAHFIFNGVNPFGPADLTAGVWFNDPLVGFVKRPVAIEFASLASQATGPPLDETEMSYKGRTFPQLGKKMLSLTPLGQQYVHPNDSVLGPLSGAVVQPGGKLAGSRGLKTDYTQMIKAAFQDYLWNSPQNTPDGSSQMAANFSLFWGLAIQLYEATLVADQTPFDRFLGGDKTALTSQQQDGFNIFFGSGRCDLCHGGSELTNASVRAAAFVNNATNALFEQMTVASGQQIVYDSGFNNTAVRPTSDDIGRGGNTNFNNPLTNLPIPLSFSLMAELQAIGNLPFASPLLPAQLPSNFPVSVNGSFKVPGLRNVELTAPYFHNGDSLTLEQVVDFYTRGGNFPAANVNDLDINIDQIGALQNKPVPAAALVAFMKSLTDERVRNHSAPFDHPELFVPNGDDALIKIPARDGDGNVATTLTIIIDPVASPTNKQTVLITGIKEAGASVQIQINNGPLTPADSPTATTWSIQASGFVAGDNIITVTVTDQALNVASATANLTLVPADGNFKGTGVVDVSDALKALRIATGLVQPSPLDMLHGDVSPLVNGSPAPNNQIDVSDALVILRKAVGLISF